MDTSIKVWAYRQGGRLLSDLMKVAISHTKTPAASELLATPQKEALQGSPPSLGVSIAEKSPITQPETAPGPSLPTSEETNRELKRRLARELYKAELDLAGGLLIAGKPCDCLEHKHTLLLEAAAEELVSAEPSNTVYLEIIQWIKDNQSKVTVKAIVSGTYRQDYPAMAHQFKEYRKRVMDTVASEDTGTTLSLEQAKKMAAEEAAQEVERQWDSQGKK